MKAQNYTLNAMSKLLDAVALMAALTTELALKISDSEYDQLSDRMAEKGLARPLPKLKDYTNLVEEIYNYLDQLCLDIDRPF